MNVVIYGATGFLGLKLIESLLTNTDWNIYAVGRNPAKVSSHFKDNSRVVSRRGDVASHTEVLNTLTGMDVAYYLVHMMGRKDIDFYEAELNAAKTFITAVNKSNVRRVVYMGGLGAASNSESRHLLSRHITGEIMRTSSNNVIELRASMIIGEGSVAYDIIRNIVHKLPIMILPASSSTLTQPIALKDALSYLTAAATVKASKSMAIDIGGSDVLSYADIYQKYAKHINKTPLLVKLPYIPDFISSAFLNLMTPKIHARIGKIMLESMNTNMVIQSNLANTYFPDIKPVGVKKAIELA
jgi:uncharacterized protein YbjT (DUF2867 family)